jgi:hypothetical protein
MNPTAGTCEETLQKNVEESWEFPIRLNEIIFCDRRVPKEEMLISFGRARSC